MSRMRGEGLVTVGMPSAYVPAVGQRPSPSRRFRRRDGRPRAPRATAVMRSRDQDLSVVEQGSPLEIRALVMVVIMVVPACRGASDALV